MNIYSELSKINVNDHTETKNGLTYLSWAWAIDTLEKFCDENSLELVYGVEGIGDDGLVHTYVMINGKTKKMWLPVMDYRNRSIEQPTTTDINKAYMRCLTKNIALWGLGLYIYAGEDLPNTDGEETKKVEMISDKTWKELNQAYSKEEIKEFYKELNITNGKNMTEEYAKGKLNEYLEKLKKEKLTTDKEFY